MSLHHGLRSAAGASVADPDFKNVSLLLLGNGTNGGQNNTFTDDSSNAFSVTRYGNTTQGSFSPFGYNWSNYFDGSGDYLQIANNSAFNLGSSNFTVEAWIYPTTSGIARQIIAKNQGTYPGGYEMNFLVNESNNLQFAAYGTSLFYASSTATISTNTWTHVAAVRNGSTITLYINGVADGTVTAQTIQTTTSDLTVARDLESAGGGRYFTGFISSARILKGTAQYTANFTPSTSPLTAITNTSLLTCQSNRFVDNSSNAFTITPYGDAKVTNFAPFPTNSEYSTGTNGGSGYFDGSGDYLSTANNGALDLGSGDFTVECWYYSTSASSDGIIYLSGLSNGYAGFRLSPTYLLMSTSGSSWLFTDAVWSANINQWNHLAVTRSGSTLRVFLNGSIVVTKTISGSLYASGTQYTVGRYQENGSTYYYYSGAISSLRILKGTAQYTANFTPSTTPLTAITNTSILLNFTNGSIIDSTGKNDLETVGDAQVSTSVKKYGTGSLAFDGTDDALKFPISPNVQLGSGDWTIEAWVNITAHKDYNFIYSYGPPVEFYTRAGGYLALFLNDSDDTTTPIVNIQTTATISTGQWTHVAAVRNGSNFTLYINGVSSATATSTSSIFSSATQPSVGNYASTAGSQYAMNGYIDDLRITKGVARYTAAFTPPSRQLPAR